MNLGITNTIHQFANLVVSDDRKEVLQPLIDYIQSKTDQKEPIRLNFICTHNSRRSHLSQIWAQTLAFHFGIPNVSCYSGGTEATAMFPKVVETLRLQGFDIQPLSDNKNTVYFVKYAANEPAIICFSKEYDHPFNPSNQFGAVVTCNSADENCPFVTGAEKRLPIKYDDPKAFDGTDLMVAKYAERSLEIGGELYFVFSKIRLGDQ